MRGDPWSRGEERGAEEGVKTLPLSTHAGLSGSVNGGEIKESMTRANERNLQKRTVDKNKCLFVPFIAPQCLEESTFLSLG